MNEHNSKQAAKKVKYIASIIYLIVLTFVVGGSYINQQQEIFSDTNADKTEPQERARIPN